MQYMTTKKWKYAWDPPTKGASRHANMQGGWLGKPILWQQSKQPPNSGATPFFGKVSFGWNPNRPNISTVYATSTAVGGAVEDLHHPMSNGEITKNKFW